MAGIANFFSCAYLKRLRTSSPTITPFFRLRILVAILKNEVLVTGLGQDLYRFGLYTYVVYLANVDIKPASAAFKFGAQVGGNPSLPVTRRVRELSGAINDNGR